MRAKLHSAACATRNTIACSSYQPSTSLQREMHRSLMNAMPVDTETATQQLHRQTNTDPTTPMYRTQRRKEKQINTIHQKANVLQLAHVPKFSEAPAGHSLGCIQKYNQIQPKHHAPNPQPSTTSQSVHKLQADDRRRRNAHKKATP